MNMDGAVKGMVEVASPVVLGATMMLSLLLVSCAVAPTAQSGAITIDATSQKPISPLIYGVNFPDWDALGSGFTLARLGGNRTTAYNWETNASNAGNDYRHQNDGYMGESDQAGKTYRDFMRSAQAHGARVLLTIPTAGYVSADKKGDGDVKQTPNYLEVRFHKSLASKNAPFEYPPNTKDRTVYQDEFVWWLEKTKSDVTPVDYILDNEPDIWHSTHARIVPRNLTYAEIIANNVEFATAIKKVAPKALVYGPSSYGWQGFRRFQGASDANDRDFLDVYLAAMKAAEAKAGRRLLDVLDIHWYPEAKGGGKRITTPEDAGGLAEARVQAPRSLWDPTYVEDSWISDVLGKKPIALLPGVMKQIETHYPGTKLAINEYHYGGERSASGAVAQADVLGVFGRYGLYVACNWGLNAEQTGTLAGFKAFIDFDRKGSRFGDLGLAVSGENPASNSVYAALDSKDPSRMTIVAINKTAKAASMRLAVKGFAASRGDAFVIDGESLASPRKGSLRQAEKGVWVLDSPPMSVATVELRK